jgi:cation diffusion facilitator family transporter
METPLSAAEEKSRVAVSSVIAAFFLTGTKIVVGIMTGSLGILSEAAHSALDLVAALVTVFAVKTSGRPADDCHPYGHGKVENLSALFETLLLLLTCVWIIKEAVERLIRPVPVEASFWGFAVIVVSIIVDIGRSRALMAAAKKHNSQALEADALHFSTDVWSSTVVLFGLGLVFLSKKLQMPWLVKADAIAALAVAGIVVWVSIQLGRKTIHDLLDGVPTDLTEQARTRVLAVSGVLGAPRIRMRRTGGEWFSDVVVLVDPSMTVEEAHAVADSVETSLKELMPGADVVVHTGPMRATEA